MMGKGDNFLKEKDFWIFGGLGGSKGPYRKPISLYSTIGKD